MDRVTLRVLMLSLALVVAGGSCFQAETALEDSPSKAESADSLAKTLPRRKRVGADTQYVLGWRHERGEGVPQDCEKAVEWYTKAAHQGHAGAQYNLGIMYDSGQCVSENHAEAIKWYTKAAEQNIVESQYNLGAMYYEGTGVPGDFAEAFKWWEKAAEQNLASAQYAMGWLYHRGEGVPRNYVKAIEWYTKAAEQNIAEAHYNLGIMYYEGYGVPQDLDKALKWHTEAAELGHAIAQRTLGWVYYRGEYIPPNYVLSYAWFNVAASQGDTVARNRRNELENEISAEELADAHRRSIEMFDLSQTRQSEIESEQMTFPCARFDTLWEGSLTPFVIRAPVRTITLSELKAEGKRLNSFPRYAVTISPQASEESGGGAQGSVPTHTFRANPPGDSD